MKRKASWWTWVGCLGVATVLAGGGCGSPSAEDEDTRSHLTQLGGKADVPDWLKHVAVDWGCDQTVDGWFVGQDSAHVYSFPGKVGYRYNFSFEGTYPFYKGAAIGVYDAETGQRVAFDYAWDNQIAIEYTAERSVKYLVAVYSIYVYATGWYSLTADCEMLQCESDAECDPGSFCKYGSGCSGPGVCVQRPQGCYEIYAPVCGCDGQTYDNDCMADAAGVAVDYQGQCKTQENPCQAAGGYCAHFMDACDSGFVSGPPLDCPLGRSGQCCLPAAHIELSLQGQGFMTGEMMEAKVVNDSQSTLFLPGCGVFSLEEKVDGGWVHHGPQKQCVWEGEALQVGAGEVFSESMHAPLGQGTWRLTVQYGLGCEPAEPLSQANCAADVTLTSDTFLVKECPLLAMPNPDAFCPDGEMVPVMGEDGICVVGYDCELPPCRATGCSGQICADQDMISTCEWWPWYSCYDLSECGRFGPDNTCAWKETPAYLTCMADYDQ